MQKSGLLRLLLPAVLGLPLACVPARSAPKPVEAPGAASAATRAEKPRPRGQVAAGGCGGRPLQLTFYDVGQGLASLVRLPNGRSLMVDTGDMARRPGCGDACARWSKHLMGSLARDLESQVGLELLFISHQHSDHYGNADGLLQRFLVKRYVDNGTRGKKRRVRMLRSLAERKQATVAHELHNWSPSPDVRINTLRPRPWPVSCDQHQNDCSLILRIDYCRSSILFVGDAEEREERALVELKPATLLQVGHHGSATSSSEEFLARVSPRYAVISSAKRGEGTNRRYCHPRLQTIQRLNRRLGSLDEKRRVEAFGGRSCGRQKDSEWERVPISRHLYLTAHHGDVRLQTTGDGVFVVP